MGRLSWVGYPGEPTVLLKNGIGCQGTTKIVAVREDLSLTWLSLKMEKEGQSQGIWSPADTARSKDRFFHSLQEETQSCRNLISSSETFSRLLNYETMNMC
jgi:hypothetical protein